MARSPSEYQLFLPLDFTPRAETQSDIYSVPSSAFIDLANTESDVSRFVSTVQENLVVTAPGDAARYLMEEVYTPFEAFEQEELFALMLNTKNRLTHIALIYRGTVNAIQVRVAEIFRPAVRMNATSIIIAHNHPSGIADPSPEDVRFSEACVAAGRILDVKCLDHLVIGQNHWVSLKERQLGFGD